MQHQGIIDLREARSPWGLRRWRKGRKEAVARCKNADHVEMSLSQTRGVVLLAAGHAWLGNPCHTGLRDDPRRNSDRYNRQVYYGQAAMYLQSLSVRSNSYSKGRHCTASLDCYIINALVMEQAANPGLDIDTEVRTKQTHIIVAQCSIQVGRYLVWRRVTTENAYFGIGSGSYKLTKSDSCRSSLISWIQRIGSSHRLRLAPSTVDLQWVVSHNYIRCCTMPLRRHCCF